MTIQLAKHLPHKHEDMSLEIQNPCQKPGTGVCIRNYSNGKTGSRQVDLY